MYAERAGGGKGARCAGRAPAAEVLSLLLLPKLLHPLPINWGMGALAPHAERS